MSIKKWFKEVLTSRKNKSEDQQRYVLWVTKEYNDPTHHGFGGMLYGWSRGLTFTYEEAVKEKDKVMGIYDYVEILKWDDVVIEDVYADN